MRDYQLQQETGKSNYTDYLITEPIDLVEELKRVPEADYELCTALLTMLVKEEIPENASDKTFSGS